MAQAFPKTANSIARTSIVLGVLLVLSVTAAAAAFFRSSYVTGVGVVVKQPVPFSHAHHVGGEGIDCRYCHTTVETEAYAGIPPTHTCMTCHSQIWKDSPLLEPVRESFATGRPLEWQRVHDLPDFAYFNHSIHVNKGVGCTTCHGQVNEMQLTFKTETLFMEWCINCHRSPEKILRKKEDVFSVDWQPPANQLEIGEQLSNEYQLPSEYQLTSCSTCHR